MVASILAFAAFILVCTLWRVTIDRQEKRKHGERTQGDIVAGLFWLVILSFGVVGLVLYAIGLWFRVGP
jgi:hypothetical protein